MCETDEFDAHENGLAGRRVAGASFAVSDMTCSHCVSTLRAAIERALPGVPFTIDLDAQRVAVVGDAAAAQTAAAAIRAAGYTPELVDA